MKQTLPISIVIPTLNEEKMLPRLLNTIKEQEFQPYEIIVADSPKTTDKTKEIAKSYGAKLVEGGIVARGRNNGGKAANGEIILFLDADALLANPYFLGEAYVLFKKNNLDIASSFLDLDTTEKRDFVNSIAPKIAFDAWNKLKKLNSITKKVFTDSGTGIIVKKEVFDKLNGFREDKEFIGEDFEFTKRAVDQGYKYMVLPIHIISSGRRYEDPSKAVKSLVGTVISVGIIAFGLYNSDRILKLAMKLYGELGGGQSKQNK